MEHYALVFGYHYERGLADGRNQPQFRDDVSYINHYATIGLEAEVTDQLLVEAGYILSVTTGPAGLKEMNATADTKPSGRAR